MSSIISLACRLANAANGVGRKGLHNTSNTLSEGSEPHPEGMNGPKLRVSFASSSTDSPKGSDNGSGSESELEHRRFLETCRSTLVDGGELEIHNPCCSTCAQFESCLQSFIDGAMSSNSYLASYTDYLEHRLRAIGAPIRVHQQDDTGQLYIPRAEYVRSPPSTSERDYLPTIIEESAESQLKAYRTASQGAPLTL